MEIRMIREYYPENIFLWMKCMVYDKQLSKLLSSPPWLVYIYKIKTIPNTTPNVHFDLFTLIHIYSIHFLREISCACT